MTKLYKEFKASLKDIVVEEVVDLLIFRPIAYIVVKLIYRFPITPNQISVLAILTGIASGVFFAMGDRRSFIYAGLLYAVSHILDCCDGMIARLKKNGTPIGRIIDGVADYITSVAIYIGLLIGLHHSAFHLPVPTPWLLMLPAAILFPLHTMKVDYYRHEFLAHALGKVNPILEDLKFFTARLEELNRSGGKYLERILITLYVGYTKLQVKKVSHEKRYSSEQYYESNKILLQMWNWIGLSTHIFVMIVAMVLYQPMIFFYYVLGAANVWWLVIETIQVRTNRKIAIAVEN